MVEWLNQSLMSFYLCPSNASFLVNTYLTYLLCQDNEPLMRALSKLINLNSPDLVLFVGEALVGNDAVDQLTKFNQVLIVFQGLVNATPSVSYYKTL